MARNSRMPCSLAADHDAECSACLAGARRLGELFDRYGVAAVEACFEAILSSSTEVYRREGLSPIPAGTHAWGGQGGDPGRGRTRAQSGKGKRRTPGTPTNCTPGFSSKKK